jgi:hypothetical protein
MDGTTFPSLHGYKSRDRDYSLSPTKWEFYLRTETESKLLNVVLNKNRTIDNVQSLEICRGANAQNNTLEVL